MTARRASVAVVGAGPAGAYLASLLAEKNFHVTLFDPKVPWEKPCGGGITFKTFLEFPIIQGFDRCQEVTNLRFFSPGGKECEVVCEEPLRICAREELGEFLLQEASRRGVTFFQQRVKTLERKGSGWGIQTDEGNFEADFLVGADGGTSLVRRQLGLVRKTDRMTLGVGYYLPQTFDRKVVVKFLSNPPGYFWVFPRRDHSSVGLCATARFLQGQALFDQLDHFIQQFLQVPIPTKVVRCGAQIPVFDRFDIHEVAGVNWTLVGDAAGLVDPITKEGIYYAIKSASLLAQAMEENRDRLPAVGIAYSELLQQSMLRQFRRGRLLKKLFYKRFFLDRMVAAGGKHPAVNQTLQDLICGRQNYEGLGRRLLRALW